MWETFFKLKEKIMVIFSLLKKLAIVVISATIYHCLETCLPDASSPVHLNVFLKFIHPMRNILNNNFPDDFKVLRQY